MTLATTGAINYEDYIQDARVHGRLYYDPAIFAEEMEKIWYREWVFVGHDSEVPSAGDVLPKQIGLRQVFLARDEDGQAKILRNLEDRTPIARYGSYRGFVFGSFADDGPGLEEHLGHAKSVLDHYCDLSPTGELDVRAGVHKLSMDCNWKMQLENSVDNYHGNFVHESNIILLRKTGTRRTNFSSDRSVAVQRDLGNGHTQLDFFPEVRRVGMLQLTGASDPVSPEARSAYVTAVENRLGKERATELLRDGTPHVMIFPNLFIIQSDLRIIQPVNVKKTYVYQYVTLLKGAPKEMNVNRLRRHEHSYGPAGFILNDDVDIFERNQIALEARGNEWMEINRGLHRETVDENGFRVAKLTDEMTQRAIWRHYKSLMMRTP